MIKVDQKKGDLFWVSCQGDIIGTTSAGDGFSQQLYNTTKEVRNLSLDWLRGSVMWLEDDRLVVMSSMGGQATELLQLGGGVTGNMAFDLRANSLLWNSITGRFEFLIGTHR